MELVVMALIVAAVLTAQYFLYSRLGLKNLLYTLTVSTPEAFEGDEIEIVEEIENDKLLPLPWIRTEINCSRWLTFRGQTHMPDSDDNQRGLISGIFVLKGHQKCRRVWRVRCEKRGLFTVEDTSVAVSDIFGLVKPAAVFRIRESVRVLPRPSDAELPELSSDAFIGDMQVRRFVLPDPFMISGAKEYSGREPMNRIHWSQTARTGSLMAYSNEFSTERQFLIIMNIQRGFMSDVQPMTLSVLEGQIKAAAFMLDYCCKIHAESALAVNSAKEIFLPSAEGYEHTIKALRELAELKNECGCHIDDYFDKLSFCEYTDIVFITGFLSEKTAETLRRLRESGKNCLVISTEISETEYDGVINVPRRYYSGGGGE